MEILQSYQQCTQFVNFQKIKRKNPLYTSYVIIRKGVQTLYTKNYFLFE